MHRRCTGDAQEMRRRCTGEMHRRCRRDAQERCAGEMRSGCRRGYAAQPVQQADPIQPVQLLQTAITTLSFNGITTTALLHHHHCPPPSPPPLSVPHHHRRHHSLHRRHSRRVPACYSISRHNGRARLTVRKARNFAMFGHVWACLATIGHVWSRWAVFGKFGDLSL